MSRRLLILGCGYLGERVTEAWQSRGGTVIAVTRSSDRAARWQTRGWTPYVGDVCDSSSITNLPEVDVVLFAIGYDRQGPHSQRAVYVDGLATVVAVMKHRCRRFLYVSSSSVYGQQDGEWVDEESPCAPTQPGGQLCLEAESLVHGAFPNPGTGVALRFAGIYGPGRLLSRVEQLRAGTPLTGRPDAWLNLIHVDDGATTIIAAADSATPAPCYLVCDDQPVHRGDYYAHLASLIGAPPPTFDESTPAKRGSGSLNKRCRNTRMKGDLLSKLQYPSFREGLDQSLTSP